MTDFDIMLKALKLAWIPRLLQISDNSNWCIFPKHYFRSKGGLNFLLRCNQDTSYFNDLQLFCKKILEFFNKLKSLYPHDQKQEFILFNSKDILVDGKPIFLNEWFKKGILLINDLLSESSNILTFHELRDEYSCKSNFLQYCQVVSPIPKRLWSLAKGSDTINKLFFTRNSNIFSLNESTQINLYKAKSKCDDRFSRTKLDFAGKRTKRGKINSVETTRLARTETRLDFLVHGDPLRVSLYERQGRDSVLVPQQTLFVEHSYIHHAIIKT